MTLENANQCTDPDEQNREFDSEKDEHAEGVLQLG
jgi:hypothetical protein